jgi:hypothetical protein
MKLHTRVCIRMVPSESCANAQSQLPPWSLYGQTTTRDSGSQLRP